MITIISVIFAVEFFIVDDYFWGGCCTFLFLCTVAFWIWVGHLCYTNRKEKEVNVSITHEIKLEPESAPEPKPSTPETRRIFSDNLKYYLKLRGKDPDALRNSLHVPEDEWMQWLNAEAEPDESQKDYIARYLDIKKRKLDEEMCRDDEEIRSRVFKKAVTMFELVDSMPAEKAEAAEKLVEQYYNAYNGY